MRQIQDLTDDRNKAWCIHCRKDLSATGVSRDHVPSKALLSKPCPDGLPTVPICRPCNEDFARDEEYFAAFLSCVLSSSIDPQLQIDQRALRILSRSAALQAQLEQSKIEFTNRDGTTEKSWSPESDRLERVILKNARGHAIYEFAEPLLVQPTLVRSAPIATMTTARYSSFFNAPHAEAFPEVGSRMLSRIVTGADLVDGWIEVQKGVYRYSVAQIGGIVVRTVIREYLATEILWSD